MSAFQIMKFASEQALDTAANVLSGATLTFSLTGVSTPTNAYANKELTTPLANPLSADSAGNFVSIFLDPAIIYRVVLKSSVGATLKTWDPANEQLLSQALIGLYLYPRTAAEILASVTPVNYAYAPGNILRYGADPTGVADSWAAIDAALRSNSQVYIPPGTYAVSATLSLASNQILYGDGSCAILRWASGTITNIQGSGVVNTQCRDFKIEVIGLNTGQTTGGIAFVNTSLNCLVERVEMEGLGWAGVWIYTSNYCVVRNCYFHDWQNNQQDSADVTIYALSTNNIVEANRCFGGGWHGVMVQAPFIGGSQYPKRNLVHGNRIGEHTAYGVLIYNTDAQTDGFNTVSSNVIDGILGTALSGASGAGVYIANFGGCIVANNTISNCCVSSTLDTLTPAGIGINADSSLAPFCVVGNVIIDMANYRGIHVVGAGLGGTITGNTIRFSAGAPDYGILIDAACNNVIVANNTISILTSLTGTEGILIFADGANCNNIAITGNTVTGCALRGIEIEKAGAFAVSNFTISGNVCTGGGSSTIPLRVANGDIGTITGNVCLADTAIALAISSTISVRITNNHFTTTGSNSVNTAGTCSGGYFDKSNRWNGTLINGGTGLIAEQLASAVPSTGTAAVGDRAEMSVPVVGSPKGWRCTVAGAPGTWVSEGNL